MNYKNKDEVLPHFRARLLEAGAPPKAIQHDAALAALLVLSAQQAAQELIPLAVAAGRKAEATGTKNWEDVDVKFRAMARALLIDEMVGHLREIYEACMVDASDLGELVKDMKRERGRT